MTQRLDSMFRQASDEERGVLSIYLVAGFPDMATSEALIAAAIEGGADCVEIGIPWSDPGADGPVIQSASAAALRGGARVEQALDTAKRLRARFPETPLIAMTYANIAHRMGWDRFARALASAGFDGAILADVSLEESDDVRRALQASDLAWIPLVAPTTPAQRMSEIARSATGFLYVVSNVGITGQGDPGPLVEKTVARARGAGAEIPLMVGFGIRSPDDVRRVVIAGAQGAIVGSHIVGLVAQGGGPDEVRDGVRVLAEGTR